MKAPKPAFPPHKVCCELAMRAGKSEGLIWELVESGWVFQSDTWEDRHKFEEHEDIWFASPNMTRPARIHRDFWNNITKEYLLEREAYAVAFEWSSTVFHHNSTMYNPLTKELQKYFMNNEDCKFKQLQATDIEFDVKINPKKNHLPKKVKVTITIE